ncbi:putative ABC transporter ATP binding protein required for expression of cytochrome BD [Listeria floridensis FSL S10-1187]|uniref:ABC transporter ATP binding protein required for expression of cytochrome BD n=1 Tax=Listeria floridensis FSL S10-1187 TaxID=1265817 RepID=A0ABN0RE65_9LIST|nr:thiol reductant ABC exporter subunit CydC [Listeria floridensis]EUJ30933.1 putative ABC transporter ATP binding protein required for expression of cytochrome BD [Listeria floridensis FSL S10-1187]
MLKNSWIGPYIKQNLGLFILVISLGVLTFSAGAALMFTSGHLISKSSLMPESIMAVYVATVGVRAFGIMRSVSRYIERLSSHSLVLRILEKMRVRLYRILEPQALLIKSRYRTGDILGLLADDIEHIQNFYLTTMFPAIVSLVLYSGVVIALGVFSIPFAILMLILIGLLIFVLPGVSLLYAKGKNAYLKQGRNGLYSQFTDAVFGLSDWMFSGRAKSFIKGYEQDEKDLLKVETKQFHFVNWRDFFSQLIIGAAVVVMVYWSAGEADKGAFSATLIAAFTLAILSLGEAFVPVSSAVSDKSLYQDSLERLGKIEDPSLPDFEHEMEQNQYIETKSVALKARNLSFQYNPSSPLVLNQFNFTLLQGEKVAIIGRSGTGKSTFLKLVQGALLPTSGEITMNGVSVDEIRPQMAQAVSMLNQKAHLFSTSVLNNIRMGNQNATDEEVYEAARKVNMHDFIMSMPDGYKTQMAEMGARFSGGERQRIALARILLQNTPIVILDEPTVGLDPITERDLLKTIFETLKDKSLIWVTHHLVGAEKMDSVLFLEDGAILMQGTHSDLMQNEPRYRHLYELDRPIKLD